MNDLEVPGDDEELCICLGNAETDCTITNSQCNAETDTCVCRDGFIGNASTSCVDVDTVIPIGDGGDDSDSGGGGSGGGEDSDVDAPSPSPSLSPDTDEDKGIVAVEESSPSHEDKDDDMDPAAIFGLAVAAMVIMALIALFLQRRRHRRNEGDTSKHHPRPSMAIRSLGSLSGEHLANEDQDVELNNRLQLDVSRSHENYNFCFGMCPAVQTEGMVLGIRVLTQDDHNKNQNVELSNRLRPGDSSSRFYKETESRFGMYPEGRTEGMVLGTQALTQDVHKCNSATCELCVQSRHSVVQFLPVQTEPTARQ